MSKTIKNMVAGKALLALVAPFAMSAAYAQEAPAPEPDETATPTPEPTETPAPAPTEDPTTAPSEDPGN
ncbi:MAG: hypothetical protein BGO57_12150 [Sphingomonadales bacterium 63-6]|nr:MAG: hypothetical protein BGO57_12150 [Sphingomonadales bacterium 63-6]